MERLEDRLHRVSERLSDLESANKRLNLEWTELYDKVRHQMSRMARRKDLEPVVPEIPDKDSDSDGTTPGLDPISESILRRRGMRAVKQ